MTRERVMVAMSGGVDSAAAAALLVEQGHEVVGATLKLWCYGGGEAPGRSSVSRAVKEVDAARASCAF
jgi:tRNA-specific 2-thiouridylase